MEYYKTFLRNNRTVLIGHILVYAQGIVLMPIIINTAGLAVYGGYILVYTLLNFVYGISSFGVGLKNTRFLPAAEERFAKRAFFYPQFFFQLLSIAVLSAVFMILHSFLGNFVFRAGVTFSKWLIFPYLISMFFFSQAASYFLYTHRVKVFNYATTAFPYLNIGIVVIIYLSTRDLTVNKLLFTQIIAYMVIAIPLILTLYREIGIELKNFDIKQLLDDIRLGFPLRINYVMDFLLTSSDRYLITYFINVAAVGYYSPGYAIGSLIIFFPRVSGVVLMPLLSKAIDEGDDAAAHTMFDYTVKGFLLLAIPFIVGSAVMSKQILGILANAEVSQRAYLVTPLVAAATLFFGLNIIVSNVLLVRLKTSAMLNINAIATVASLGVNLIFLPVYKNVLVSAFAGLFGQLAAFVLIRKEITKYWPVHIDGGAIIRSVAASVLMGTALCAASYFFISAVPGPVFVISGTIIGAVVYAAALLSMKTFSREELSYFRKVFA